MHRVSEIILIASSVNVPVAAESPSGTAMKSPIISFSSCSTTKSRSRLPWKFTFYDKKRCKFLDSKSQIRAPRFSRCCAICIVPAFVDFIFRLVVARRLPRVTLRASEAGEKSLTQAKKFREFRVSWLSPRFPSSKAWKNSISDRN